MEKYSLGYDVLAREYYNPFHKTCRNFDLTTTKAIESNPASIPDDGLVLEVGCGRGRCFEFLGIESTRVVQLDYSSKMLSIEEREPSLLRIQADATSVPIFKEQFSAVIGFLVDPFLGLNFLNEAFRLLTPGGILFFTTPTEEWGKPLRDTLEIEASFSRFLTENGDTVIVASTLISDEHLNRMLQHIGFTNVNITSHCLPKEADPISPDIQRVANEKGISVHNLPIIHIVAAVKP